MVKIGLISVLLVCIVYTQTAAGRFNQNHSARLKKTIKDGTRMMFGGPHDTSKTDQVVIGKPTLTKIPIKPSPFKRTIIAIRKGTRFGEYLYVRGGGAGGKPISIRHRIAPEDQNSFYASTSRGDNFLDWGSNERTQGRFQGITPQGTPMIWTTNNEKYNVNVNRNGAGYYKLNVAAGHFWLVDLDMNCSQTTDGWFEFKAYLTSDGQTPVGNGWERNFERGMCNTEDGPVTFDKASKRSNNHFGKCGEFTMVHFEEKTCFIHSIKNIEQWAEELHGENPTVVQK